MYVKTVKKSKKSIIFRDREKFWATKALKQEQF